jgi:hypothetical protein
MREKISERTARAVCLTGCGGVEELPERIGTTFFCPKHQQQYSVQIPADVPEIIAFFRCGSARKLWTRIYDLFYRGISKVSGFLRFGRCLVMGLVLALELVADSKLCVRHGFKDIMFGGLWSA